MKTFRDRRNKLAIKSNLRNNIRQENKDHQTQDQVEEKSVLEKIYSFFRR